MARRVNVPTPEAVMAAHDFRFSQWGHLSAIGKELGITKQAISGWQAIPAECVRKLSDLTGIPPWRLRPDLYDEAPRPRHDDEAPRPRRQRRKLRRLNAVK